MANNSHGNPVYMIFTEVCTKYFGDRIKFRSVTTNNGITTVSMRAPGHRFFIGRDKRSAFDTGNDPYYPYGYVKYMDALSGMSDEYSILSYGFMLKSVETGKVYQKSDVETVLSYDYFLTVKKSDIVTLNGIGGINFSTKDINKRAPYYTADFFNGLRLGNRNPTYDMMLAVQHFLDTVSQCEEMTNISPEMHYMSPNRPALYGHGLFEGSKRTEIYKLAEMLKSRVDSLKVTSQVCKDSGMPLDDLVGFISLSNKNFKFSDWDLVLNSLTLIVHMRQTDVFGNIEVMMAVEPTIHNGRPEQEQKFKEQVTGIIKHDELSASKLRKLAFKLFGIMRIQIFNP